MMQSGLISQLVCSESEDNIAPPAAAEFAETGEERAETNEETSGAVAKDSVNTKMEASPSIFDIGLSKYGLEAVLGKTESSEDRPRQTEPKAVSPSKYFFPLDEDPESSPALRLRSRPLSGLQDMSGVDLASLTPGLDRRSQRPQEVAAQDTPEFPLIQSDASYLLAGAEAGSPERKVSRLKKEHLMMMNSGTPGTPEMPELQTVSMRQFLGQERTEGSPETPDLTSLPPPVLNMNQYLQQ